MPDWAYEDLAHLVVRARTSDDVRNIVINFNRREGSGTDTDFPMPFAHRGETVPVVSDGTVQTYRLRLDFFGWRPRPEGSIRQLALWFDPSDLASIDILSITLTTKVANYAETGAASRTEIRNRIHRQALYTHTPGSVEYRVKVPEGGRLFYRNGADELVAAQVTTGPTFTVGQQEVLFSLAGYYSGRGHPQYDVTPDDQRFVMLRFGDEENAELVLVLNFFEELKERVPN